MVYIWQREPKQTMHLCFNFSRKIPVFMPGSTLKIWNPAWRRAWGKWRHTMPRRCNSSTGSCCTWSQSWSRLQKRDSARPRSMRPCWTSRSYRRLRSPPTAACWKKGRTSILVMSCTSTPCNSSKRPQPPTRLWMAKWNLRSMTPKSWGVKVAEVGHHSRGAGG